MINENRKLFINYAHRGASEYCPENTFSAFYMGIFMNANGIETDIQKTKDGVLVLFHDDTLVRVTGAPGKVSDYTFAQLQELRVSGNGFIDKIVSLEDFLEHFSFRDITFAIELKQSGIEKQTVDTLNKYNMKNKTVITSFKFDNIRLVKEYDSDYRVGFLTSDIGDEVIQKLLDIGVDEICPKATLITIKNVEKLHSLGFNVRAWGVTNEDLMKHVYNCGVDGMTINFPDKLNEYLKESDNYDTNEKF